MKAEFFEVGHGSKGNLFGFPRVAIGLEYGPRVAGERFGVCLGLDKELRLSTKAEVVVQGGLRPRLVLRRLRADGAAGPPRSGRLNQAP